MMTSSYLITQLGETDQQFLQQNSPELALQRGQLRLQLVALSKQKAEQIYFLQQALAILEQARLEFDDIDLNLYLDLSICLAKVYMMYFECTQDKKFAIITQQILKPLSHYQRIEIYQLLLESAQAQGHQAMQKYWQQKLQSMICETNATAYS